MHSSKTVLFRVLACSILIFLTVVLPLLAYTSRRDPTSIFFRPAIAFAPRYSLRRQQQANFYIESANRASQDKVDTTRRPRLCVGIASIDRQGPQYFSTTVGSILADLHKDERAQIHLVLFLAHSDQSTHPAYHERWLENVADSLLSYGSDQIDHIKELETQRGLYVEKGLLDYVALLNTCRKTNASHVLVLEDDVLALDGWYHRAMSAVAEIEGGTHGSGRENYLYLRLFFTESFFGWNSEEWPTYLFYCVSIFLCELLGLVTLRRRFHKSELLQPRLTVFYLFGITPLLMVLFFVAGRHTLLPPADGVIKMPKFGCCSQGLMFPQARLGDVIGYLEDRKSGFADVLLEEYANSRDEVRWALQPSVLQHIGAKSSKDDGTKAETGHHRIFNFRFEDNDVNALKVEHQRAQVEWRR